MSREVIARLVSQELRFRDTDRALEQLETIEDLRRLLRENIGARPIA